MGGVIESLLSCPLVLEIITVNDGSTDNSLSVLQSFGKKIVLLSFKKNHGKAAAITAGIKKARADLVLFVDADLQGFKPLHVKKIVDAYQKDDADGVIADLVGWAKNKENKSFYWEFLDKVTRKILKYDLLTGERLFAKKDLLPLLPRMKNLGYGLEVFLNHEFKKKKIKIVHLKNVHQSPKEIKNGFNYQTVRSYLKEGVEISQELARQQGIKGKEMIKFQKKYLHQFMKTYIKSGRIWKERLNKYILAYLTT